jgi:hypothetical protein
VALARAQINLLAMLGEWQEYADPDALAIISSSASSNYSDSVSGSGTEGLREPSSALQSLTKLPESPTKEEVEIITRRMYEQTAARRRLGMRASAIVQKSFSGERYLREHEQMLWVGKAKKDMRRAAEGHTLLMNEAVLTPVDVSVRTGNGLTDFVKVARGTRDIPVAERVAESSIGSRALIEYPPSLGFGTSSEETSLLTDSGSIIPRHPEAVGSQVIRTPPEASINIKRLRREKRRVSSSVGSGAGYLPSLGFETSAEETSILTDSGLMVPSLAVAVESQVIKMMPGAIINIKRLRREERRLSRV